MAKLIVNPTSPSRREVSLSRTLLSIGRDPSNDVVLPDAMVSRRHAVIEYRGSQYFLRDCNSSNGSLINGDRVSERGLRDGDLVAIGTARLLFRDDLVAEDAAGKVIHHPSAPRQHCLACGQDYRKGDVYCRHCGSSLAPPAPQRTVCTACGTAVTMPARFCTACGARLGDEPAAEPEAADDDVPAPPPVAVASGDGEAPGALPAASAQDRTLPPVAELPAPAAQATDDEDAAEPEPSLPAFHVQSTADELPVPAFRGPAPAAAPPRPALAATPVVPIADAPLARAAAVASDPWPDQMRGVVHTGHDPAAETGKPPVLRAKALSRLGAFVVDALIVGAGQAVLALPALVYWMSASPAAGDAAEVSFLPVFLSVALATLAAILAAVYHVYFWGVKAATPGKRLFGLVVTDQDGRQPIGPGRAALRLLGYGVSALVFGIGFLMIAFGGGGLHDQIAGTRVIRKGD
jgi:uncharacterized RDD family membrane protein YckC